MKGGIYPNLRKFSKQVKGCIPGAPGTGENKGKAKVQVDQHQVQGRKLKIVLP
jgi:hypothetical protein